MSFFNSLLSSIEKPGSAPTQSTPNSISSRPNSTAPGGPKPGPQTPTSNQALKRKASDGLDGSAARKSCPLENQQSQQKPIQLQNRPAPNAAQFKNPSLGTTQASIAQHASPQRPLSAKAPDPSTRFTPSNSAAAAQKPTVKTPATIANTSKPAQAATSSAVPTTSTSKAGPPKRSSYKELMARAQAVQASQQPLGQIKHKAVSKLSRREKARLAQKEAAEKAEQEKKTRGSMEQQNGRPREAGKPESGATVKKRPALETGYKGTMRTSDATGPGKHGQSSYKGTMKAGNSSGHLSAAAARSPDGKRRLEDLQYENRQYRYASYSDEDDVEEEEEDYDDEDDDDGLEGGGFHELEEEEEASMRAARLEDARAAREEEQHRLEKRKRLEALAKAREGKRKF